ncbi:hypothetical protein IW262DRAFT_673571 [Armillaria fumosa]|nr:hypothetical protein IW262DRAFT_673571 [Armillaria fumosa]
MPTNLIWAPCSGCPCPNHHLPSCTFTVARALSDDPEWVHLTRSNNPPSQYEETVLSGMISSYDQQIQCIDAETSNLEAFSLSLKAQIVSVTQRMDALCRDRARITEAARESRNLLNPVRCLPLEILNHIFLDTIDFPVSRTLKIWDEWDGEEDDTGELGDWEFEVPGSSLWSIAEVSKTWRNASLSFPKLWSYVNIVITESNFKDYSYIRQLDRSANHPLSISVCRIAKRSAPQELPPQLAAVLFSFSSRIQELHLYLTSSILFQTGGMRLYLPSLECLVLLCQNSMATGTYEKLHLFSYTPKLQSLEVIGWRGDLELPWSQLKEYYNDHAWQPSLFRDNGPRAHRHLNALRKLQHVEECVLRFGDASYDIGLGDEVYPLIIPQLRMLHLSSWNGGGSTNIPAFPQVVDRLVLPALSVLKVACSQRGDYERKVVFASICQLLQRSQSPITVLHFDHGIVNAEDLLELFPSTPTLEDLRLSRIRSHTFINQVVEKLTLDHTSSAEDLILPRLCTLYMPGIGVTVGRLLRMVESRRISDNSHRFDRLQTLRLSGIFADSCPPINSIISHFKQYYVEGFSFGILRIVE